MSRKVLAAAALIVAFAGGVVVPIVWSDDSSDEQRRSSIAAVERRVSAEWSRRWPGSGPATASCEPLRDGRYECALGRAPQPRPPEGEAQLYFYDWEVVVTPDGRLR